MNAEAWNDYVDALTVEDRDPFWWLNLPPTRDPDDWWKCDPPARDPEGKWELPQDTHGPWPAWAYEPRTPPAGHETSRWTTSVLPGPDAYLDEKPAPPSTEFLAGCLAGYRMALDAIGEGGPSGSAAPVSGGRPTIAGRRTR